MRSSFKASQIKYLALVKKVYATDSCLKKMFLYLEWMRLTLFSGQGLLKILLPYHKNAKVDNLSFKLNEYNIYFELIPGSLNVLVDSTSHLVKLDSTQSVHLKSPVVNLGGISLRRLLLLILSEGLNGFILVEADKITNTGCREKQPAPTVINWKCLCITMQMIHYVKMFLQSWNEVRIQPQKTTLSKMTCLIEK